MSHPAAAIYAGMRKQVTVDSCKKPKLDKPTMDNAGAFEMHNTSLQAASIINVWLETTPDELDEGEGYGDRLLAMIMGMADNNNDGELSEDEQVVVEAAMPFFEQVLSSVGASDGDIDALLTDFDNDVAARIVELGAGSDSFDPSGIVFSDGDNDTVFDAVYKKQIGISNGKKVIKKVRIAGTVHRSSAQKIAMAKVQRKSQSAGARAKRLKSFNKQMSMGLMGK